jgi:hypothetical protein
LHLLKALVDLLDDAAGQATDRQAEPVGVECHVEDALADRGVGDRRVDVGGAVAGDTVGERLGVADEPVDVHQAAEHVETDQLHVGLRLHAAVDLVDRLVGVEGVERHQRGALDVLHQAGQLALEVLERRLDAGGGAGRVVLDDRAQHGLKVLDDLVDDVLRLRDDLVRDLVQRVEHRGRQDVGELGDVGVREVRGRQVVDGGVDQRGEAAERAGDQRVGGQGAEGVLGRLVGQRRRHAAVQRGEGGVRALDQRAGREPGEGRGGVLGAVDRVVQRGALGADQAEGELVGVEARDRLRQVERHLDDVARGGAGHEARRRRLCGVGHRRPREADAREHRAAGESQRAGGDAPPPDRPCHALPPRSTVAVIGRRW